MFLVALFLLVSVWDTTVAATTSEPSSLFPYKPRKLPTDQRRKINTKRCAFRGGGGESYLEHEEDVEHVEQASVNGLGIQEEFKNERDESIVEPSLTLIARSSPPQDEEQRDAGGDDILDADEEELVHALEANVEVDTPDSLKENSIGTTPDLGSEQGVRLPEPEGEGCNEHQIKPDNALLRAQSADTIVTTKSRKTFDVIVDLITRSSVDGDGESQALRQLIMQRRDEHLRHFLPEYRLDANLDKSSDEEALDEDEIEDWNHYHPKRLLHFLAPKIPAIKHSRDPALRIQSARSDLDSGVAACLIGTLAHVCEAYSQTAATATTHAQVSKRKQKRSQSASDVSSDLVRDRRFEQLVECVLCGLDVRRRKREYLMMQLEDRHSQRSEEKDEMETDDTFAEEHSVLDEETRELIEEEATRDEGLSIRDSCRAAWGLALLGAHKSSMISDTKVGDILLALVMRTRELLLANVQVLRQDDLLGRGEKSGTTIEQRIMVVSEELAEDAATAMWTFACVRAVCGDMMTATDGSSFTTPLMKVCISILCHDPMRLRRQAQEEVVLDQSVDEGNEVALLQRHRVTGRLCRNAQKEIGSNDVIDRLARAEAEEDTVESVSELEGDSDMTMASRNITEDDLVRDSLLDWLSPSEVTDVMWSLATHGNKDSTQQVLSRQEPSLSETASALCFIGFDRLLAFLNEDLKVVQAAARSRSDQVWTVESGQQKEDIIVVNKSASQDLVTQDGLHTDKESDSSPALTQSEDEDAPVVVESMTIKNAEEGSLRVDDVVHVVDAASLLKSEAQHTDPKVGDRKDSQAAEVVDSVTLPSSEVEPKEVASRCIPIALDANDEDSDVSVDQATVELQDRLLFSLHDLCVITWASMELRDSLRFSVTTAASQIVAKLGKSCLKGCTGSDLSNLCWAAAKCFTEGTHTPVPESRVIVTWIAEHVNNAVSLGESMPEQSDLVQAMFQPPQLSRLVWSISSTLSDNHNGSMDRGVSGHVALVALLATERNLHVYGTEDLVRIAWAFLELNDLESVASQHPEAIIALGKVLASIELSLSDWETGIPPPDPKTRSVAVGDHPFRFLSFFGKTRSHAAALQQELEESFDEGHDDELHPVSDVPNRRVPLLKDLPVDPASLCKLAHACSKPSAKSLLGKSACEKVGRVALRLMTSRNGRLMLECHNHDLVHISAAACLLHSNSNRELISLFTRRIVAILNESPDMLVRARPQVHVDLLVALGNLGVTHNPGLNASSPHRRLQLTVAKPFVDQAEVQSLPNSSYMSLLKGLKSLNALSTVPEFLRVVLGGVSARLPSLAQEGHFCDLAEDLSDLYSVAKAFAATEDEKNTTSLMDKSVMQSGKAESNATMAILNATQELLARVADDMVMQVSCMPTATLRRILNVYAMLPYQADSLVEAIEIEAKSRMKHLSSTLNVESRRKVLEDTLSQAASDAAFLKRSLIGEEEERRGPFEAFRRGFQSLFRRPTQNGDDGQGQGEEDYSGGVPAIEDCVLPNEVTADDRERVVDFEKDQFLENEDGDNSGSTENSTEEDLDEHEARILQEIEQALRSLTGAIAEARDLTNHQEREDEKNAEQELFELGRCEELIAHYRRFDFETGMQKSRVDEESRRDMAKRVLSRLFP